MTDEPTREERLAALEERSQPLTRREARLQRGLPMRTRIAIGGLSGVGFVATGAAMGPIFVDADAPNNDVDTLEPETTQTESATQLEATINVRPNYIYVDENGEPLSEAEAANRRAEIDRALSAATSTSAPIADTTATTTSTLPANSEPPTSAPTAQAPPGTAAPETAPTETAAPTTATSTTVPPATVPPETVPPTTVPPTTVPPGTVPPTTVPPETVPPTTVPPGPPNTGSSR